jgi:large subunit ribosomal protein L16
MKLLNFYKIPNFRFKNYKKKKHLLFLQINYNKSLYNICYGFAGIKSLESCFLTAEQIEATRRIFSRRIKKYLGCIWIRKLLFIPKTEKPFHFRMGKGKGGLKYWMIGLKGGNILFEIKFPKTINKFFLKYYYQLLMVAKNKLPFESSIVFYRRLY